MRYSRGVQSPLLWTIGDSRSTATLGFPTPLATSLGRNVNSNCAVSGQRSSEIAARVGAIPTTLTVSGDSIPTSGGVTCSALSPNLFHHSLPTGAIHGSIEGVPGTLAFASSTLTFTRDTAGSATAVASTVGFTPDSETIHGSTSSAGAIPLAALRHRMAIVSYGYNDINLGIANTSGGYSYSRSALLARIDLTIGKLTTITRRVVVAGIYAGEYMLVNGADNLAGGTSSLGASTNAASANAALAEVFAVNAALAAAYPGYYLDLHGALVADGYGEAATVNGNAYTLINNTALPDGVHASGATRAYIAAPIEAFINAKGW